MRWIYYVFLTVLSLGLLTIITGVGAGLWVFHLYSKDLPDYNQLKTYEPPVLTRIHAGDGRLMAEFAEEKRVFVPIDEIPPLVANAFISAEDKNFYHHKGVDLVAVATAAFDNLQHLGSGARPRGASTITQQVAKNFLLSGELSYKRKIREAILAYRMEQALSKRRLLELYLNEIYLGGGSYGVAAAALQYFNKSLDELTVAEAAYLAALPKAPNNYHPVRQHDAAVTRRNWVIDQMRENGYISASQAALAKATALTVVPRDPMDTVDAAYFTEEVRRQIQARFGSDVLYEGGLSVRTTIDPHLQEVAVRALRRGLVEFDHRKGGWRGPVLKLDSLKDWATQLTHVRAPDGMLREWSLAVVLEPRADAAQIGLPGGEMGSIPLSDMSWAGKGGAPSSTAQVLKAGDVILTEKVTDKDSKKTSYALRQVPVVQGAIVVLDPHTGRVLALQGGWKFDKSQFNRATQAMRQPGSAFKPFIYLAALERGFTPSTMVLDAPVAFDQGPGLGKWRPTNYSGEFYGPTPLRVGVEKSRNLMTVRLADHIGMKVVVDYAKRFGISDAMSPHLANALGSEETTLLRMSGAYGMLANGGIKITPTVIDRIQDRRGRTLFSHDLRHCDECGKLVRWESQAVPRLADVREQVADPRAVYQMISILEGVVQRGTAARLKFLNRPVAGKTGTTNDSRDTWFVGFTPDLVCGVFIGYDEPKNLGRRETGASVAAPVFGYFMDEALKGVPPKPFRIPPGIVQVQVNPDNGLPATPGDESAIWESYVSGTEPEAQDSFILDSVGVGPISAPPPGIAPEQSANTGTGGLY